MKSVENEKGYLEGYTKKKNTHTLPHTHTLMNCIEKELKEMLRSIARHFSSILYAATRLRTLQHSLESLYQTRPSPWLSCG